MKEKSMLEEIWGIPDEETPMCDCGKVATYLYGPGFGSENPFFCDDCVPRDCTCNHNYTKKYIDERGRGDYPFDVSDDYSDEPPEDRLFQWLEEGYIWQYLDETGRPYPCCEYISLYSARNAVRVTKNP